MGREDEEPYDNKSAVFLFFLQKVSVTILSSCHHLSSSASGFVAHLCLSLSEGKHTPWTPTLPVGGAKYPPLPPLSLAN